jgi:hypothetical protein
MQQAVGGPGTSSPGRLLISHITLRGPELQQTYERIVAYGDVAYQKLCAEVVLDSGIHDDFGLADATLREALNFLVVARLVQRHGGSGRTARFHATPLLPGVAFPLLLLHHIGLLSDERQRAPVLIQRQLTEEDVLSVTPVTLREHMERGPYATLFTWTNEKAIFWGHLAAYLGLVRRLEREGKLLLVPQPTLVLAALRFELGRIGAPPASGVPLAAALDGVEAGFFGCFARHRRVHRGLAQTLIALHRLGQVRLTHESDASRSLLLGNWRVSHICFTRGEEGAR